MMALQEPVGSQVEIDTESEWNEAHKVGRIPEVSGQRQQEVTQDHHDDRDQQDARR